MLCSQPCSMPNQCCLVPLLQVPAASGLGNIGITSTAAPAAGGVGTSANVAIVKGADVGGAPTSSPIFAAAGTSATPSESQVQVCILVHRCLKSVCIKASASPEQQPLMSCEPLDMSLSMLLHPSMMCMFTLLTGPYQHHPSCTCCCRSTGYPQVSSVQEAQATCSRV